VAELEQPFGCDEGRDRRAINARHARLEVVDAYHVPIERALKLSPVLWHAAQSALQADLGHVSRSSRPSAWGR
jgi:hypothetical protein